MDVFHVYEMQLCPLFCSHYGNENVPVILSVGSLLKVCITRVRLVFRVGEDYLLGDHLSVINTIYR